MGCCGNKPPQPKKEQPNPPQQQQIVEIIQEQPKQPEQPKPVEVQAENLVEDQPIQPQEDPEIGYQRKKFEDWLKEQQQQYINLLQNEKKEQETTQTQYTLHGYSDLNQDCCGPKIINVKEKTIALNEDVFGKELSEIQSKIESKKILFKGILNICSYEGEIDKKQYFVKVFTGIRVDDFKVFIKYLKESQLKQSNDFKKYIGYQIKEFGNGYGNASMVQLMEQYNLYSFSALDHMSFEIRRQIAKKIVLLYDNFEQQNELKQLHYIRPQNILISHTNNGEEYNVKLSDWQFYLEKFDKIISGQQLNYYYQLGFASEKAGQQDFYMKIMMLLLFFQINLSSKVNIGNLDGRDKINDEMKQHGEGLTEDLNDNFFKSKGLEKMIQDKIRKNYKMRANIYEQVWKLLIKHNIKEFAKQLDKIEC